MGGPVPNVDRIRWRARTFDALLRTIGGICDLFEPHKCRNHLKTT
jgi:hypothetical protein